MPRGVYERKPKGEKAAAAPAKKAPTAKGKSKQTVAPKAEAKKYVSKPEPADSPKAEKATKSLPALDIEVRANSTSYLFNMLNNNIVTFSGALNQLGDTNAAVSTLLQTELAETVKTVAALRNDLFSDLMAPRVPLKDYMPETSVAAIEAESTEEVPAPAPVAVPAPVAAPLPGAIPAPATMTLPKAPFTPPAPPTIPQH